MGKEANEPEVAAEAEQVPANDDNVIVAPVAALSLALDAATPALTEVPKVDPVPSEDPAAAKAKADKAAAKAAAKAKAEELRAPAPPWLTGDVLVDRLRLNSDVLVDQVFAATLRQMQSEDQREGRLDAKAQGLLGTAGLSLTVAFTFGGILLQHPEYIGDGVRPWIMSIAYGMALVLGLTSSIFALRALWVRGSKGISERDVFNETELLAGDWTDGSDGNGVNRYKRFMVAHIWQVYQTHADNNASKAGDVKRGQWFFIAFLVSLLLIGGGMAEAAFEKLHAPTTSASDTKSPPPMKPTQSSPSPAPPSRPPPTSIPSRGSPEERSAPATQSPVVIQPNKNRGQR